MSACPGCKARVARLHRFCPRCGTPAAVEAASPECPTVPERTPPRPVTSVRRPAAQRQIQMERKQVSVLFVDLCESTVHVRAGDPEEARACLDEALKSMTDAVDAYGGTVSQLLGDGLLALFGAPVAQEDHALRACLAALAMHKSARTRSGPAGDRPFVLRVGIHSGEVIVGLAGQYLWSHYRADGTTIHVASRLEKLTEPGCVWISEATQRLIAEQLDTRPLGPQQIRGAGIDMQVFELLPGAGHSAAAPLTRRRQWTLVGREEPLRLLGALADAVRRGAMRAVGLRGEPGIGKSRLIVEWCASASLAGFVVCATYARGYSRSDAYGVIAEMARNLVRMHGITLEFAATPQVDDGADLALSLRSRHLRAISHLINVAEAEQAWITLSPTVRRRHLVDALVWLITEALRDQPLLLLFEDIFLVDRESQRLLEQLVPRLDGMPVLVCVSYRQDFEHRWGDAAWFVEHWLAPLRGPEMSALALAMLGTEPSMQALVGELVERADGNPFFLEQLIITLIDDGSLVGTPGAYRLTLPQADLRVPGSIAAVISARVDRLPAAAKTALEAAAVLAEPITAELIADMQEVEPAAADALLRVGAASGLLIASSGPPAPDGCGAFSFRHALVQEVVAGTLTRPRRKALHRRAFVALRHRYLAGETDQAPTLTRHAFAGEEWQQAAAFAAKSITRAVACSANREALRLFELGVDAARRVADRPQGLALELGLLLEVIGALMALGHIDAIFANLERAQAIASELGDVRCQATVALQTSLFQWMRGRYTQGLDSAGQALDAGRQAGRRNLQMAASQTRMMMFHGLGRYREAVQAAEALLEDYAPELREHRVIAGWATLPIVNLHSFYANSLARLGEHEKAQASCELAYAVLAEVDHPYSRGLMDFTQAHLWIGLGRHDAAAQLARSSVELCAARDVPTLLPCALGMLGGALAEGGAADEAARLLQGAIDQHVYKAGGVYGEFFLRLYLGVAHSRLGHSAEAIAEGEHALQLARDGEQHGHQVDALLHLGLTLHRAGRHAQAAQCLEEARSQATRLAMPGHTRRADDALRSLAHDAALLA